MLESARLSLQPRGREVIVYDSANAQAVGSARDERTWLRRVIGRLAAPWRRHYVLTVREQLDGSQLATLELRWLDRQVRAVLLDALDGLVGLFNWSANQEFWVYDQQHRPGLLVLPPDIDGLRHVADPQGRPAGTLHDQRIARPTVADDAPPLTLSFASPLADQPLARMLVLAVGLAQLCASSFAPPAPPRRTAGPTR